MALRLLELVLDAVSKENGSEKCSEMDISSKNWESEEGGEKDFCRKIYFKKKDSFIWKNYLNTGGNMALERSSRIPYFIKKLYDA